jgi:hypothetical protein
MSKEEDVELARAWLQGKSELMDDLADVVESMIDKRLDPEARVFLSTIGRDAKAMAKREPRPTQARAPAAQPPATPTPEPLPSVPVDINEIWRRRQQRNREQRLDELARRNQQAFMGQHAFMAGNDADWRGW